MPVLSGLSGVLDILERVLTKPELCLTLKQVPDEEGRISFLT